MEIERIKRIKKNHEKYMKIKELEKDLLEAIPFRSKIEGKRTLVIEIDQDFVA